MAKAVIFGIISLLAFVAAAFSSRTSKRRGIIVIWWVAFIIGFVFHIMSLFQGWSENQRIERVEYEEIAQYSASGNKSGSVNGMPIVRTPINNWSSDFMLREDGRPVWLCSNEVKGICSDVTQKMPMYPFSYYVLALCKKETNDPSWEADAKKAFSIFTKTTVVKDHHPDHDRVLKDVKRLLGKE